MGDLRKTDSPVQTTVPSPKRTYTVQVYANIICFWIDPNFHGTDIGFVGVLRKVWVVTPRETYGNQAIISLEMSRVRSEKNGQRLRIV